ncbi:MAG: LysR family transcriptional regulator [Clostridium sp.]
MELKEARYILSIYKNKSITKAAEELYISQPSLSRYLQNMESRLGNALFSRIGNEYIPTYFGKRYLDYANKIILLGDEWEREYCELVDNNKGVLNIAIPLTRSSCILPKILHKFYAKYPNVKINLKEESHSISKESFISNEIDFAIYNTKDISTSLDYISLGSEPFVLVTPKNHYLNENGYEISNENLPFIDLALFKDENFILHYPDQSSGIIAAELLKKYNITPKTILNTRNPEVAISMVSLGTGLCFAPQSYVRKSIKDIDVSCFLIGEPIIKVELKAIYRKGEYLPNYAKYFITLVKEFMDEY